MRSCEEIEILINLYLDDMLTSEEQQVLEAHLETCPACRAKMEELCTVKSALGQLEEPVPAELHERILTYVEEQTKSDRKIIPFGQKRWYRALAGVAACAVIAVAAARFMPSLEFVSHDSAESVMQVGNTAAMPAAPSASNGVMQESVSDSYAPGNAVVAAPQEPAAQPEYSMAVMPDKDSETNAVTGQMAEDLPPLRKDMVDENNEYQVTTIRKWLKITGPREALPEWVDLHFVYEAELDGISREYVEIAEWAEEYWVDQLTACGFTVEVMEDQEVVEDGEHILLVFFWE